MLCHRCAPEYSLVVDGFGAASSSPAPSFMIPLAPPRQRRKRAFRDVISLRCNMTENERNSGSAPDVQEHRDASVTTETDDSPREHSAPGRPSGDGDTRPEERSLERGKLRF